ncbi:MAG: UDP-N-acetylglucosamine 2-epimerase [Candidatus Peribacteria bacterium]|nr:UDP-N-acetylglucosamine 2-epimerase [Candidatus Peribacteria bacterium]
MKIVSIASARPNFVKLAAIDHAIRSFAPHWEHVIIHTGQHYDPLLSDIFFHQLDISDPAFNLGIKADSREEVISKTEQALVPLLEKLQPDFVFVYGDVNGAVGGARAAKKTGIQLAHIEAGLRSFDHEMPEELNRIEIDKLADFLFCTEQSGMDHLKEENIAGQSFLVGNTMIDTLIRNQTCIDEVEQGVPVDLSEIASKKFAIATIHRPSNVDSPNALARVIDFLQEVAQSCPIILPAHPRLQNALGATIRSLKNIQLVDPLAYWSFLRLMKASAFILTDSGGIQEEATFLQKKCFTLRKNTERPSTIDSGSNTLIDLEKESDRQLILDFAKSPHQPIMTIPEFWDGKAGERILSNLAV